MSLTSLYQELSASLTQAGLLEQSAPLIPPQFTATTRLDVSFDLKAVHLGNIFRASECKFPPAVSFAPEVCTWIYPERMPNSNAVQF